MTKKLEISITDCAQCPYFFVSYNDPDYGSSYVAYGRCRLSNDARIIKLPEGSNMPKEIKIPEFCNLVEV